VAWGVRRALFSNVAGVGEGTYAAGAADVSHPAKQGLVQAFSIYIDTLTICMGTGLMIVVTGSYNVASDGAEIATNLPGVEAGPNFTQAAVDTVWVGSGGPFVSIALSLFALTTVVAFYFIADTNLAYLARGTTQGHPEAPGSTHSSRRPSRRSASMRANQLEYKSSPSSARSLSAIRSQLCFSPPGAASRLLPIDSPADCASTTFNAAAPVSAPAIPIATVPLLVINTIRDPLGHAAAAKRRTYVPRSETVAVPVAGPTRLTMRYAAPNRPPDHPSCRAGGASERRCALISSYWRPPSAERNDDHT
jgi:hypothetical protein